MRQYSAISALATGKRGEELHDAAPEINRKAQNRAQLDDDGKHLPIPIVESQIRNQTRRVQKSLRQAQMRGGADRKKFGDAFDNSQDQCEQIIVQSSSETGNSIADKDCRDVT